MSTIAIHIDRLVIDAPELAAADVPRLVAALERELTGLLADADVRAGARDHLRVPDLSPGTDSPGELGARIARSLVDAIGGAT